MNHKTLPYIYIVTVLIADINDLIRGNWFFHSWGQLIFWNIVGIFSVFYILTEKKNVN